MVSPVSLRDFVLRVYSSREGREEEATVEHLVLVTYASKYGSTAETAKALAESLRDCGLDVELQPIQNVVPYGALERYYAVVLGAALYMGRLHKEGPGGTFRTRPREKREKDWAGAKQQLEKDLASFPSLSPDCL
jgi:menaquinone-dependent protoporphyrinogen oxidase